MEFSHNHRERVNLAGAWELAFDRDGNGVATGWPRGAYPQDGAESVLVPAPWNLSCPGAEGIGFYRKRFALPGDWRGRSLELCFGGASYRAEVWLNACYLGSHEGAYTPFSFPATHAAKPGAENELVVRVAGLSRANDTDGMALRFAPASKQAWYYTYAGLWGDVELISLHPVSIQALVIDPNLAAESIRAEVTLRNDTETYGAYALRLEISDASGRVVTEHGAEVPVMPGLSSFAFHIPMTRPLAWSPDDPHLYRLRALLVPGAGQGVTCDSQSARFGMRDFTVCEGQFYLNGAPIYVRGVLLQPNYPVTLIAPHDPELMAREVTLAKQAGFNLIRAHLRPAPPGYLDLCDEAGMLVYDESPMAWIRDNPRLLDHGRREIKAMIERDRNHPSVVIWGIYNENPQANRLSGEELGRYARSIDPTRVVLTHSGGTMAIDQDFGWVDRASMIPQRAGEPEPSQDVHVYVGGPVTPGVYEWLRTLGTPTPAIDISAEGYGLRPLLEEFYRGLRGYKGKIFVSELGYGGIADLDAVVAGYGDRVDLVDAQEMRAFRDQLNAGFAQRRLDRVFGSVSGLVAGCQELHAATITRQIEAVLVNARVSGFMLTQLNDVAWEFHAGLLDHWRRPKLAYYAVQRLNRTPCLVLHAERPAVAAGQAVPVTLTIVQAAQEDDGRLLTRVLNPDGSVRKSVQHTVAGGQGIRELGQIEVTTAAPGQYILETTLERRGEALATSTERIWAVAPADAGIQPGREVEQGITEATMPRHPAILVAGRPARLTAAGWESLLDQAAAGRTAIIGALRPGDETALAALRLRGLNLELNLAFGSWMGCYHWVPENAVFEGLPANTVAGDAYAGVTPQYALTELGGEVLAGSLQNTQTRKEAPRILWYSDIEVVPFGRGRLVFCQYRCFEEPPGNPVAARLARNLRVAAARMI